MNAIEQAAKTGPGLVSFDGFSVFTTPVGQGAAGKVYQAHDLKLDRPVALKFLKEAEALSADAKARFVIEARVGGQLDHPHIVPVFRCSDDPQNLYLVMGWCGGGTLAERLDGKAWEPGPAASLMQRVASAVAHAHARGVLHRDIKPSNILFDDEDVPKLADFGLAKIKDQSTALTQVQDVHGTPAYLAPEVATQGTGASSERSDVYALGAVLFELLVGRAPFLGASASETTAAVRKGPSPSLLDFRPDLPSGLVVICDRCLSRDPELRPESAERVALELERFGKGLPVQLKPVPLAEHLSSWIRCRPRLALGSFAAVLVLSLLTGAAVLQWQRASHLAGQLGRTVLELSAANRVMEEAGQAAAATSAFDEAGTSAAPNGLARLGSILRGAPKHPSVPIRARWFLNERAWIRPGGTPMPHADEVLWAAFRHGTTEVVTSDLSGKLNGWDRGQVTQWPETISPAWTLNIGTPTRQVVIAADGSGTVSWHDDDAVRLVGLAAPARVLATVSNVAAIATDPSRTLWAIAEKSGSIQWGRFPSPTPLGRIDLRQLATNLFSIGQIAIASTNGPIVVSSLTNGAIRLINPVTRQIQKIEAAKKPASELVISPDGKLLLHRDPNGLVMWKATSGKTLFRKSDLKENIRQAIFSPSSEHVVTISGGGAVTVIRADSGVSQWTWRHPMGINRVSFGADPNTLFTICDDGTIRAFDMALRRPASPANGHDLFAWTVDVSADGGWLVSSSSDRTARLWKLIPKPEAPRLALDVGTIGSAWLGLSNGLCLVTSNGMLHVWNPLAPAANRSFSVGTNVTAFAGVEDRTDVFLGRRDGSVSVQSILSNTSPLRLRGSFSNSVRFLKADPTGQLLLAADAFEWRMFSLRSKEPSVLAGGPIRDIRAAAFSSDLKRVVLSGADYSAQLYDATTGRAVGARMGHSGPVSQVNFSPDGRTVVTASLDFTAGVWDAGTGLPRYAPLRHAEFLRTAVFIPDGSRILTGGPGAARLWDAATGKEIQRFPHPRDSVRQVELSPDDQYLVTATDNGFVTLWGAPFGAPLTETLSLGTPSVSGPKGRFKWLGPSLGYIGWTEHGRAAWNAMAPALSPEEMADIYELLAGRKLNASGGVEPIPPTEMKRIGQRLVSKNPKLARWTE